MLLKEEIRRLSAWYSYKISETARRIEEVTQRGDLSRAARGELALLKGQKIHLSMLCAAFQAKRGDFV
jgi:hypothetical protein